MNSEFTYTSDAECACVYNNKHHVTVPVPPAAAIDRHLPSVSNFLKTSMSSASEIEPFLSESSVSNILFRKSMSTPAMMMIVCVSGDLVVLWATSA